LESIGLYWCACELIAAEHNSRFAAAKRRKNKAPDASGIQASSEGAKKELSRGVLSVLCESLAIFAVKIYTSL
jgi:hypothetical protein